MLFLMRTLARVRCQKHAKPFSTYCLQTAYLHHLILPGDSDVLNIHGKTTFHSLIDINQQLIKGFPLRHTTLY